MFDIYQYINTQKEFARLKLTMLPQNCGAQHRGTSCNLDRVHRVLGNAHQGIDKSGQLIFWRSDHE